MWITSERVSIWTQAVWFLRQCFYTEKGKRRGGIKRGKQRGKRERDRGEKEKRWNQHDSHVTTGDRTSNRHGRTQKAETFMRTGLGFLVLRGKNTTSFIPGQEGPLLEHLAFSPYTLPYVIGNPRSQTWLPRTLEHPLDTVWVLGIQEFII